MNSSNLGEKIYKLRVEKGLTQNDIAYRLGISDKAISKWENNTTKPTINNLQKLSEILDVELDELLEKEKNKKYSKIFKIAITGGPLGGKTTCINKVKEYFESKKYKVIIVNDYNKILKDSSLEDIDLNTLLLNRISYEEMYDNLISSLDNEKIIVLYDTSILDIRANTTKRDFNITCRKNNISIESIRNGYDAVFHLKTVAKWDTGVYEKNNQNKDIDPLYASTIDDKLINIWIPHANYRIIDNCISVDSKANNLISEISKFINHDKKSYIEKKYIIKPIDLELLNNINECGKVKMTLTYLENSTDKEDIKLLLRDEDEKKFYQLITKGTSNTTKYISPDEYISLLDKKDKNRIQIVKDRYNLVYNSTYYKIDYFYDLNLWILEIDLLNDYDKIVIPKFIEIIEDVSNNKKYKNYNLSLKEEII